MRTHHAICALLGTLAVGCFIKDHDFIDDDTVPVDGMTDDAGGVPTVVSTTPDDLETDAEPGVTITATFSEAMAPATIDSTSFVVSRGPTSIAGQVTYEPVSRVATFQPDERLSLLGGYTATLTDAITDVGGAALAADHTWTFSVRDGVWGTAQLIETDNGGNADGAQLAVDPSGNAIAVWHQHDGTRYNIWANRYVAGTGWGTAALIEVDNVGSATNPDVAVDPLGDAVAVWNQYDGSRDNVWANHFSSGTGWSTAQLIETDNAGGALAAQVAVDAGGNAIAVWMHSNSILHDIWANRFVPGTGWGTRQLLETIAYEAGPPAVGVDAGGNAIAAWHQFDGTQTNILASGFAPGTGWTAAQLLETDDVGAAQFPRIAINDAGNVVVVWIQSDGTRDNIWANRRVAGTWDGAEMLETDDAGAAASPAVALDAQGNAVAVWHQSDGTRTNIWANRLASGTGWGTAQLLETDNAGAALRSQVAVDGAGNAVAVWQQSDGTRTNIWANRYVPGTGWGTAQLIETTNTGAASNPVVAIDASGDAVAIWSQSDGTRTNVWANAFR